MNKKHLKNTSTVTRNSHKVEAVKKTVMPGMSTDMKKMMADDLRDRGYHSMAASLEE